jgi:hypothetical protein
MMRRLLVSLLALAVFAPAAHAADDKKKAAGTSTYVAFKALTGTTKKPNGRRGVMSVECGLDVPDAVLRARAEASQPRLRAAYLQTVLTYAGGLPYGEPPNTDFLARTMQRQTDQILGKPGARFLLGSVLVN